MKLYNKSAKSVERRKRALARNLEQLKSGVKITGLIPAGGKIAVVTVPLSEADIKRIKKENAILESRIQQTYNG